jgi:hypothetical protein
MKTPLKSVLATLVALFLSISLSGCNDEGVKTASQSGSTSASIFKNSKEGVLESDGTRRFYLPAGTAALKIEFNTIGDRDSNKAVVGRLLKESGIEIDEGRSWDAKFGRMIEIKPLSRRLFVSLPGGVQSVEPFGSNGETLFKWNTAEGFVIDYRV